MTVNCIAAGGQGSEERRERACQSGDARERAVRDCLIRTTGFGSGPRVALAGLGPSGAGRCFRIRFCPVPGVIFHLRFTSCTSPLAWGNLWRARATRDTTTRGRSPGTPGDSAYDEPSPVSPAAVPRFHCLPRPGRGPACRVGWCWMHRGCVA